MVVAAPAPAGPATPAGNPFLASMANSPLNDPLPAGTTPDTAYLAFMRGLGFNQSEAYTNAASAIQRLQRDLQLQTGSLAQQGEEQRQGVTNGYLSRNDFRSGIRLEDLAKQRAAQQTSLNSLTNANAEQLGGVRTGLQQSLAQLAQQKADQTLALQQRNEQQAILAGHP